MTGNMGKLEAVSSSWNLGWVVKRLGESVLPKQGTFNAAGELLQGSRVFERLGAACQLQVRKNRFVVNHLLVSVGRRSGL